MKHIEKLDELHLYSKELVASCNITGGLLSNRVSATRLLSRGKDKRLEVEDQKLEYLTALEQRTQGDRLSCEHSVILRESQNECLK